MTNDPNPLIGNVDLDTVYTGKTDRTKSAKNETLTLAAELANW